MYDLKEIMTRAWKLYRTPSYKVASFSEALSWSWAVAKYEDENDFIIEKGIADSGVTEPVKTWYAWKDSGRMVIHESKCLFQVTIHDEAHGKGKMRILSYFGLSQTEPLKLTA